MRTEIERVRQGPHCETSYKWKQQMTDYDVSCHNKEIFFYVVTTKSPITALKWSKCSLAFENYKRGNIISLSLPVKFKESTSPDVEEAADTIPVQLA